MVDNQNIVFAVIGIAVVAAGAGLLADVPQLRIGSIAGSTLCSLGADQVDVISNDPVLDGQDAFFITAVSGCSDHIIEGGATIPDNQLSGTDPDTGKPVDAESDVQIGATTLDQWTTNTVPDRFDQRLDEVRWERFVCDFGGGTRCNQEDEISVCESLQSTELNEGLNDDLDFYIIEDRTFPQANVLHCFVSRPAGRYDSVQSSTQTNWETEFTVCASNDCESETITKQDSSATIGSGDKLAHITWTGDLTSDLIDVNFPTSEYKVAREKGSTSIHVVKDSTQIDPYKESLQQFKDDVEQVIRNDRDDGFIEVEVSQHNAQTDNVFVDKRSQLASDVGNWVDNVEITGNQLRLNADEEAVRESLLGRPQFSIRTTLAWVGFNIRVADLTLNPVSDTSIQSGSTVSRQISVANTADVQSRIQVDASCPSTFVSSDSTETTIDGNSQQTVTLRLGTQQVSQQKTVSCTVTATDLDTDRTGDTTRFDITLQPAQQPPTPGTETKCNDGIDNDNDGRIDDQDPDCQDGLSQTAIIAIILGGIALVGGIAYGVQQ